MRSLMFVLACVAVLFLLVPAPAMATGGLAVNNYLLHSFGWSK